MTVDATALAAFNGDQPPAAELAAPPPPDLGPPPGADPADAEAPFGRKADGTPRKSRPGPGRPKNDPDGAARTGKLPDPPKPPTAATVPPKSYAAELEASAVGIWLGLSVLPGTAAYAGLWRTVSPGFVNGLDQGAQHSPWVRNLVSKTSGEGSVLWVLPVTTSAVSLGLGVLEILRNPQLRREMAEANTAAFQKWMQDNAAAMGLETPQETPPAETPDPAPDPTEPEL